MFTAILSAVAMIGSLASLAAIMFVDNRQVKDVAMMAAFGFVALSLVSLYIASVLN